MNFSHQFLLVVFHWRLSDSKFLFSVWANLKSTVVCMVSILPQISNSSSLFFRPLGTVQSAPTTIGITVTFNLPSFLKLFGKIQVFVYLFTFFYFHSVSGLLLVICVYLQVFVYLFTFFYFHSVSGLLLVICMYLQVPENFRSLIY